MGSRESARRGPLAGLIVGCLWLGACDEEGGAPVADADAGGETGETGDEYPIPEPVAPSNLCQTAPEVTAGRFSGALAEFTEELDGPCGTGGPDAFFRISLPRRADLRIAAEAEGFVPRVGVLPSSCVPGRELACSEDGSEVFIEDLAAGSELIVVVGAADPGSLPSLDTGELPFSVDLGPRWVLGAGEPCWPEALGRCAHGTTCLPDAATGQDGTPPSDYRCRELPGDNCATATALEVSLGAGESQVVTVALDPALNDAHAHGCVGEGRAEHVLRVALDPAMAGLDPGAALEVSSLDPDVGLALRAPGCTVDAELDCAEPSPMAGESRVTFPALSVAAAGGGSAFLFIELPAAGDPPLTAGLELAVVDG